MANTKSTTTATKAKAEETKQGEVEILKQKLAEMEAQMQAMLAAKETVEVAPKKNDRRITFVNLTQGTVVLKGTTIRTIEGFMNKRTFTEREAQIILSNSPNAIKEGLVYIADANFVEENDLEDVYMNLLSDKQLKALFEKDANYIIEAYKSTSEGQQKAIVDMIISKKINGEEVDANVLTVIGKLCNKDLVNIDADD